MDVARGIRAVTAGSLLPGAATLAAALAVAPGCAFDTSGNSRGLGELDAAHDDEAGDDGSNPTDPQPEPEPEPSDGGADDGRTDGGADDGGSAGDVTGTDDSGVLDSGVLEETGGDGGTTSDGGGDAGTTGGDDGGEAGAQPDCPTDVFELYWADSANITDPMTLLVAADADQSPGVAVSTIAEEGSATFSLHFDCAGEYAVFGLVWDYYPGALGTDDPDSFYVGVGGPEPTWRYGCETANQASGLSWQRLEALQNQPCDTQPLVIAVAQAGDVELTFRNREPGWDSEVAGIAAIVVASDPQADPYELYAPY